MRITVLAGGIGGARFLRGLKAHQPDAEITVIGNTGDDIWVHGLRVCPDLDTVMYTLGDGISAGARLGPRGRDLHGQGRAGVVRRRADAGSASATRTSPPTSSARSRSAPGYTLTEVTAALCDHWQPGVRLLPMSDDRAETHVIVDDPSGAAAPDGTPLRTAIHFQEWWIRYRASLPAHGFALVGIDSAQPGPEVIEAITSADVVLFPPSNPVVSIGTILQVPGDRRRRALPPGRPSSASPPSSAAPRCAAWPTPA